MSLQEDEFLLRPQSWLTAQTLAQIGPHSVVERWGGAGDLGAWKDQERNNLITARLQFLQWLLVWQEVFDLWPYRQETTSYPDLALYSLNLTATKNELIARPIATSYIIRGQLQPCHQDYPCYIILW